MQQGKLANKQKLTLLEEKGNKERVLGNLWIRIKGHANLHTLFIFKYAIQRSQLKHIRINYYSFLQSFDISSRLLPFVSGTSFQTNRAARIQITP